MDLKEFVKTSLIEILGGVKEAQAAVREEDGSINPPHYGQPKGLTVPGGVELQYVDFDVAVTASEGSELSGGISVVGIGAKGSTAELSSSVSRIKFRVPVGLPVGKAK